MSHNLGPFDRTNDQGAATNSSATTVYDQPEPSFIKETNDAASDVSTVPGSDSEHMQDAHDEKAHNGVNATFEDGVVMESGPRGYMVVFGGFLVSSPLSRIPIHSPLMAVCLFLCNTTHTALKMRM